MLADKALDSEFERILAGDPSIIRNPYPVYKRMREAGAVYRFKSSVPVLTSHAAIRQVLGDPNNFLSHRGIDRFRLDGLTSEDRERLTSICKFEELQISGMNGDQHRRVRSAVQKGFGAPRATEIAGFAQEMIDEIIEQELKQDDEADLLKLAFRLPLLVVMRLLGAPVEDIELLRKWSDDIAAVKQYVDASIPPESIRAAYDGINELKNYIGDMAKVVERENNRTHLMGILLDASEKLSNDELSATFVVIFYAGHETTTNLIGNGFRNLLTYRDQWKAMCSNSGLIPGAIEEALRYDPPVQLVIRRTAIDTEVQGQMIPANTNVVNLFGAANRDPEVFEEPEKFDITRGMTRHFGFGHGPHVCIGAALARTEAKLVFETFSRRFPDLALAEDPDTLEYHAHPVFHGLKRLPVTLGRDYK